MPRGPRGSDKPDRDRRTVVSRRERAGALRGPAELAPGYQAGRGRGYATERAYERLYSSEQDLRTPEIERGRQASEGAWGGLARRQTSGVPPGRSQGLLPEERPGRGGPGGPHAGRGPAIYRRSDDRINEALCDELMLQPEIDPSEVTVRVEEGVVTMTGQVPDRWTKLAVEEVAESTLGVLDVHNHLRLRSSEGQEERRLAPERGPGRRGLH